MMPAADGRSKGSLHVGTSARAVRIVAALVVAVWAAWVAGGAAQSQNPFGTPSADKPQPGSTINAVPGSRAQGWLAQGRSEVLARHGIVSTSDPRSEERRVGKECRL